LESNHKSRLIELLARARKRYVWHLVAHEVCLALSVSLGVVILLLVLGTEILDWPWPVAALATALALTLVRVRSRVPSAYQLLQSLDRRLSLSDRLSTAFYFSEMAGARWFSEQVQEAQRREAEQISGGVDLHLALPFRFPAAGYSAIFLLAGAVTLLGLRYGLLHTLDLRPPIATAVVGFFRPAEVAADLKREQAPKSAEDPTALPAADEQRREARAGDAPTSGEDLQEAASSAPSESGESLREGETPENASEAGEGDENQSDSAGQKGDESAPPSKDSANQKESSEQKRPPFPQQKDSDLLRKMQDAFANLLAKLKVPPRAGEGNRVSERGAEEAGKSGRKEGQKGRELSANADAEGTPTADPQGTRSMEAGQQAREGKGEGGDQVSDRPGQEQARSGAGSKDGNKDLKEQEQLEAMGKLSEILGKRAENITGEVMIEVSSGDQRLRTAYSDTSATHRAAGDEIHRDEVPLVLQPYVQRYFEEVRKSTPRRQNP
jgi:hypothetical protein